MLSKLRKIMKFVPQFFTVLGAVSVAFAMLLSMVNVPVQAQSDQVCPETGLYVKTNADENLYASNQYGWIQIADNRDSATWGAYDPYVVSGACMKSGKTLTWFPAGSTGGSKPGDNDISHVVVYFELIIATLTNTPESATPTNTPVTPTPTNTPVTTTPTNTPVTPTPTNTPVTPTPTNTPVTPTPTNTPVTPTPTNTPVTPTPNNTTPTPATETPTVTPTDPGSTPTPGNTTPTPANETPTATPTDPGTTPTPDVTEVTSTPETTPENPTPTPPTDETPDPTQPPTLPPPVTTTTPTVLIPVTGMELGNDSPIAALQSVLFNGGLGLLGLGLVLQSLRKKLNF